jgi:SAM-dependent methyltransferase
MSGIGLGAAFGFVLALVVLLDAIRLRARWRGVLRLGSETDAGDEAEHVFVSANEGDSLDRDLASRLAAHARQGAFDVVDLVPERFAAPDALAFLRLADPAASDLLLREIVAPRDDFSRRGKSAGSASISFARRARAGDRFAMAASAADGLFLTRDVAARIALASHARPTRFASVRFIRQAKEARRCAARWGYAVVPGRSARPPSHRERAAALVELFGPMASVVLLVPVFVLGLVGAAFALDLFGGLAALAALHAAPLVALARTPVRCPLLLPYAFFRTPWDLARAAVIAFSAGAYREEQRAETEALRKVYDTLLEAGIERFFEPRRADCPLCGGASLRRFLRSADRNQQKPGRFTLERCDGCGHIFQNPRLSLEGLNFYYRDFYDGLGERVTEALFGAHRAPYLARARMLEGRVPVPARWLDVGAGHGHFCHAAREVWPSTEMHGLDLSDGVDLATRRGWIDVGIRGLFPEKAAELAGRYDVVSMSHYLEHTRDPEAELNAAATALAPSGHLLIEVPDPESRLGRILRTFWVPWFQPQHQHLLSVRALDTMLRRCGFEPILWHRGEAHQRVDFFFAALYLVAKLAGSRDAPWVAPRSRLARGWAAASWLVALPLLLVSTLVDRVLAPLFARKGWSNTYRVLARREAASSMPSRPDAALTRPHERT